MQQSLLENTLCLIEFSGDDPNFLQWIGWIRDNLGKENAPKIYLIGLFQLSDPQKKLLEDRQIVLVDMENHSEAKQNDHGLALKVFFDYLSSKKQITTRLNWPEKPDTFLFDGKKEIVPQVEKKIKEWKQQRDLFPNWVVLPEEKRQSLSRDTENWTNVINFKHEIPGLLDIEFLYELNWRLEICLSPIYNHLIESYEKILDRHSSNSDKKIRNKWLELQLSILRFYREEHFIDKWSRLDQLIAKYKQQLSPELLAKWNYERCLQALFSFDVSTLNKYLDEWPIVTTLPFWEAKRAGLLAELGQLKKAESILEKSLQTIRSQLNLSPTQNYYWLSRESYVLQLLKYVQQAKSWQEGDFSKTIQERYEEYSARWNILLQHKCDPWGELKLFQLFLNKEPQYISSIVKKPEFDIGKVSTTRSFIGSNDEAKIAYAFLRFCEETGIPFQIPGSSFAKETMGGAIKRIAYLSHHWALISLLRANNTELVDSIFNREDLSKIEVVQVDILISNYLDILHAAIKSLEQNKKPTETNIEQRLIKVLPEILSRLCLKCSATMRDSTFILLKELYNSDIKEVFNQVETLMERLLNSYSNFEQYKKIPELLEFPVLEIESDEPFRFLHIDRTFEPIEAIKIDPSKVSNLIDSSNIENNKAIRGKNLLRLAKLFELGLLNKKQTVSLSSTLWSQIDDAGLPNNTYFSKWYFIVLPHPKNINPEHIFKEYVKSIDLPSLFNSTYCLSVGKESFSISNGSSDFIDEILSIQKRYTNIDWSEDELISFVDKLIEWWNKEKNYLEFDSKDVKNEFVKRFNNITKLLSYFILPKLTDDYSGPRF